MPKSKEKPYAHEVHRRCGLILSGSRVKRRMRKRAGKQARFGAFVHLCAASIIETCVRQKIREAAALVKTKAGDEGPITIRPIHLAKSNVEPQSVVRGLFPSKVAGIYTKNV